MIEPGEGEWPEVDEWCPEGVWGGGLVVEQGEGQERRKAWRRVRTSKGESQHWRSGG